MSVYEFGEWCDHTGWISSMLAANNENAFELMQKEAVKIKNKAVNFTNECFADLEEIKDLSPEHKEEAIKDLAERLELHKAEIIQAENATSIDELKEIEGFRISKRVILGAINTTGDSSESL